MTTEQTNVTSMQVGRGSSAGIANNLGRFAVTTMEIPWNLTRDHFAGKAAKVIMVESMELEVLDRELQSLPPVDAIVTIGGGQACDFGKYLAWKRGCRVVSIPTVVSVNAFVTPSIGVRSNHRVQYLGSVSPDPLIVDYDLIRTAPPNLNIAGVGDILSIHTGTFDWEVAHRAGRDTHNFDPEDVRRARAILDDIDRNAAEIRAVSDKGIQTIVDAYITINTICLPKNHYRTEEGSEHFLFYELEERLQRAFIHGEIVGLGIYLMSRLQKNRPEWITGIMDHVGLNYQPSHLNLQRADLATALRNVRSYTETANYWYSNVQENDVTESWIDDNLKDLQFPPFPS
jgi:glycerol-1-phosphate dehydrogenase [NAD(P)+]